MSNKAPRQDVPSHRVPCQERVKGVSSDSPDPLHELARLLARQAVRELLADAAGAKSDAGRSTSPSEKTMTANETIRSKGGHPSKPLVLHTVQQVAETLQVSTKQVRRWIASGDLVAHRLGRQLRIADADLRAFVAQRRIV